jgi:hypothetical protein
MKLTLVNIGCCTLLILGFTLAALVLPRQRVLSQTRTGQCQTSVAPVRSSRPEPAAKWNDWICVGQEQ